MPCPLRSSWNCGGSWLNRIEGGKSTPVRLTKSVHAVLPGLPTDDALALPHIRFFVAELQRLRLLV